MSDDPAFALHLEEYRSLRQEIIDLQRLRATTAQFGLAGVVAIWSYLLSLDLCATDAAVLHVGWGLPVAVALGGLAMTRYASRSIRHGGAYLALIEERYADGDVGGWHNRLNRMNPASAPGERPDPEDAGMREMLDVLKSRTRAGRVSDLLFRIWSIALIATLATAVAMPLLLRSTQSACT